MQPIIIAGMNHSGSTMLAEAFAEAGLPMCLDRYESDPETGEQHGECEWVTALSKREFARNPIKSGSTGWKCRQGYVNKVLEYRKLRMAKHGALWGLKEPQICAFIEAWFRVLPKARYIMCTRDPHRVGVTRAQRGHVLNPLDGIEGYCFNLHRVCLLMRYYPHVQMAWYEADGNPEVQQDVLRRYTGVPIDIVSRYRHTPINYAKKWRYKPGDLKESVAQGKRNVAEWFWRRMVRKSGPTPNS